jgi:hypothetical protein
VSNTADKPFDTRYTLISKSSPRDTVNDVVSFSFVDYRKCFRTAREIKAYCTPQGSSVFLNIMTVTAIAKAVKQSWLCFVWPIKPLVSDAFGAQRKRCEIMTPGTFPFTCFRIFVSPKKPLLHINPASLDDGIRRRSVCRFQRHRPWLICKIATGCPQMFSSRPCAVDGSSTVRPSNTRRS